CGLALGGIAVGLRVAGYGSQGERNREGSAVWHRICPRSAARVLPQHVSSSPFFVHDIASARQAATGIIGCNRFAADSKCIDVPPDYNDNQKALARLLQSSPASWGGYIDLPSTACGAG